ncbi:phosphate ABC transporter permease PstA [Pantoea sp. Aalb]|uniref:phosphate ABC transporter permease PstA n=1 Tax=Pantoea sp. Aalb TaxID=2576762 RepID=UPI00132A6A5E|nr:phosphate ABC transporter permease PstA [Pantoea sp. Aalb]MXP67625.1 phosphate ABC transporter permease PstA [Pantoea sp. Aalb]
MTMIETYRNIKLENSARKMYIWRSIKNKIASVLSLFTMVFGLFWLIWIFISILTYGIKRLDLSLFISSTPAPNNTGGGLANAFLGSGLLIFWSTFFGTPLGVLVGIYLAEYGKKKYFTKFIRLINDVLLSAPSIVIGLFVYTIVVSQMHHFSGWAGVMALTLLHIPIVTRTTENMLCLVPNNLREAAYALGTPKWKLIFAIILKVSLSGIITGVILAIARITGETAPLLFTTLSNQFWSINMMQPLANVPITILKFIMSPYKGWQNLAWSAILVLILFIFLLNILARIICAKNKY